MVSDTLTVLIADDSRFLIDGAVLSLSDYNNVKIVGKTDNPDDTIKEYEKHKPDVVLTDIMFGADKTGMDVLDKIMSINDNANVIIFSQYDDDDLVQEAYTRGAKAFLTKDVDETTLYEAILSASKGRVYFLKKIAERMALINIKRDSETSSSPAKCLSDKEMEVFLYIADGLTQPEISDKTGYSPRTIASLSTNIKQKLNVTRNAHLTLLAVKYGCITA